MKPSIALAHHRAQVRAIIAQSKLRNPRLFGSVARGTDEELSDIDILVDAPRGVGLLHICGVQLELEKLLGFPVDLVTMGDLREELKRKILESAEDL